jgi:CRP/FNR family transcriptional regulator
MEEIALLKQVPLFADMTGDQLQSLAGAMGRCRYDEGQVILRQGDKGHSLFVVISGRVRIYTLSPEGYELSVWICNEGAFLGEMSLLSGEPWSASAEAMQPTEVLELQRQAFRDFLLSNPQTAIHTIEMLGRRLRHTTESLEALVSLNTVERVSRQLLALLERYGGEQEKGLLIDLDLSQEAIASLVGTTREGANRALSSLRSEGILQVDRSRIRVLQPEKLKDLLY